METNGSLLRQVFPPLELIKCLIARDAKSWQAIGDFIPQAKQTIVAMPKNRIYRLLPKINHHSNTILWLVATLYTTKRTYQNNRLINGHKLFIMAFLLLCIEPVYSKSTRYPADNKNNQNLNPIEVAKFFNCGNPVTLCAPIQSWLKLNCSWIRHEWKELGMENRDTIALDSSLSVDWFERSQYATRSWVVRSDEWLTLETSA